MRRLVLWAALALPVPAHAAVLQATPASFATVARAAKGGDTIVLSRGEFGHVVLPAANHASPVTIDARQARASSLMISDTAGWKWWGGLVVSPATPNIRNVLIYNARRIEIANVILRYGLNGIQVVTSQDVTVDANEVAWVQSDAVDVVASQRVKVTRNTLHEFRPQKPIYEDGKLVKDALHSDAIQLWSLEGYVPTSDVLISGNRIFGQTQGITHFWHEEEKRPKVTRITVEGNEVSVASWWGIGMLDAQNLRVRNNIVRTLPNNGGMKARLLMGEGERCGNVVDFAPSESPCPAG